MPEASSFFIFGPQNKYGAAHGVANNSNGGVVVKYMQYTVYKEGRIMLRVKFIFNDNVPENIGKTLPVCSNHLHPDS